MPPLFLTGPKVQLSTVLGQTIIVAAGVIQGDSCGAICKAGLLQVPPGWGQHLHWGP